jgi:hypothetical protein
MPVWVYAVTIKKILKEEHTALISFIGSRDNLRAALLGDAIKKGLSIDIYGYGWNAERLKKTGPTSASFKKTLQNQIAFIKAHGIGSYTIRQLQRFESPKNYDLPGEHLKGPLSPEGYSHMTRTSAVTLGINRVPTFKKLGAELVRYSRLRDIEGPMMGACYLTENCEGIDHLYDIGSDIEVYTNADELAGKAAELLKNPQKRHLLRKNGQQRSLEELSIVASLRRLKTALFT